MSRGFQQLERIDDLGDELPYLRGELVHRLRRLAHGRVAHMLETTEGEASFIQQMDKVYIHPRFSELVGEASKERAPYAVDLGEVHGCVTMNLPTPERLMDLMLLNFYRWQGYTLFSTPNRQEHDGHVWMAVDSPEGLVSRLGVIARLSPRFSEWVLDLEAACGKEFTPLASRLADTRIPPLLKNHKPGDLRDDNLAKRSRRAAGRPMLCVVCRSSTTREESEVIKKDRICFKCLHDRIKWDSA